MFAHYHTASAAVAVASRQICKIITLFTFQGEKTDSIVPRQIYGITQTVVTD
jgi:hypothetical protein